MNYLTVKETAQLLRVSPITVRRYIASGQLAAEQMQFMPTSSRNEVTQVADRPARPG